MHKRSDLRLPAIVFALIAFLLAVVQIKLTTNPLILLERFIPGAGWFEIAIVALYGSHNNTSRCLSGPCKDIGGFPASGVRKKLRDQGRKTGMVKLNTEPLPSSLLSQIFPPSNSTYAFEIARPRPAPLYGRECEVSA
jgi:hypothetical protein